MKVYSLRKKSEPGVVVMEISSPKISEIDHQLITNISGDLFFVFSKGITKYIDPRKFSNLYGATWYGVYDGGDSVSGIWEALDYLESITSYTSLSVMIPGILTGEELGIFKRLQYSGIETSVFSSHELGREEKAKIYQIKPKVFELIFGFKVKWPGKRDNIGTHSTRTSQDNLLFLRPSSVRGIRDNLSPEILHSFKGLGIRSFLSSLIPEETYTNIKVYEAKI